MMTHWQRLGQEVGEYRWPQAQAAGPRQAPLVRDPEQLELF